MRYCVVMVELIKTLNYMVRHQILYGKKRIKRIQVNLGNFVKKTKLNICPNLNHL